MIFKENIVSLFLFAGSMFWRTTLVLRLLLLAEATLSCYEVASKNFSRQPFITNFKIWGVRTVAATKTDVRLKSEFGIQ